MVVAEPLASSTVDALDRKILHALIIDGRAPFARIGDAIGASEQTVARRYRRLVETGIVRVVAGRNSGGLSGQDWVVRLRCRPDGLSAVTAALAHRPDTSWVVEASGGAEIVTSIRPSLNWTADGQARLVTTLLDRLPRSAAILGMDAGLMLRKFERDAGDWIAFSPGIDRRGVDLLVAQRVGRPPVPGGPLVHEVVRPDDEPLLDLLAEDGRATHRALAAASGWSESRVARRVTELLVSGVVDLDVDIAVGTLGYQIFAYLWITVPPHRVEEVGRALVEITQVNFAAAITGRAPLLASVSCRTPDELYGVVTTAVGGLPDVVGIEVTPISRRVKQAGALVAGERLVVPGQS